MPNAMLSYQVSEMASLENRVEIPKRKGSGARRRRRPLSPQYKDMTDAQIKKHRPSWDFQTDQKGQKLLTSMGVKNPPQVKAK